MASLVYFVCVLFVFICCRVLCVNSLLYNYVSLILALHRFYGTPNVCFLMSHENRDIQRYTLSHTLSREFSQKGVQTSISSFDQFSYQMNNYVKRRVDAPLTVVQLLTVEDVNDFREITRKVAISYPIWLVIFEDTVDPSICEYCNKSIDPIFALKFNTEMVVACCNYSELKEWWTVRENQTEMADFGAWSIDDGFELYATESLYARRQDLNGTGLRLVFVKNSAFHEFKDGKNGGLFGAVLMELKRVMNFEIAKIVEADVFGTQDPDTKNWSGAIGQVGNRKTDLGVGEFTITSRRLDHVDFTTPIIITHTYLYFKAHHSSGVQWSAYFRAFQYQIWLTTYFIVLTTAILVTLYKMKEGVRSSMNLFIEHFLSSWGIFCQQGLAEFPAQTPLRITYFSIFASSLVVSAAYSASLTSFLTVSTSAVPFSSLEEFVNAGTYGLIVIKESSEWDLCFSSTDPVMSKMMTLMKPKDYLPLDLIQGLQQVCTEKVALLTSDALLRSNNIKLPCKLVKISTGRIDSLAMIMPHESEYSNAINYHIQRFQDNGLMSRLKQMYFMKPYTPEDPYSVVTLWGVAPILCVLAGGFITAFLIFLCEKFVSRCRRHSWTRSLRTSQ